jgi:predicted SAM-dependent methyltransferase
MKNLKRFGKTQETKLHLGCFYQKIHGFTNVDIREDINPDLVDDVFKLKNIKQGSVDLIYTCHVLEHADRQEAKDAMKRWHEILKKGGTLRVSVPDLEAIFEYYICHKDLRALECLLYGSQKHPYDFHHTGWDFKSMERDLKEAGFSSVKRYDWRDTEHFYVDDYSQSYLPKISYTSRQKRGIIEGKLMSLNVEAVK